MAAQCYSTATLSLLVLFSMAYSEDSKANNLGRCCLLVEAPSVIKCPSKKVSEALHFICFLQTELTELTSEEQYGFCGLAMDYLKLLEERTGLSCSSVTQWSDGKQVGFTDFIHHMSDCTTSTGTIRRNDPKCRCDIGTAGFAVNPERIGQVDYVEEFANSDFRVITHIDYTSTTTGGAFFITSFGISLWVSIFGLAAMFTFLKLLDRRFSPPDDSYEPLPRSESWFRRWRHFLLRSKIPFRLRKAIESTLNRMIGQTTHNIKGDHSSTRQRILNFAIVLCGLFFILAYEATMTASLVQESNETEFRGVEDLRNCRIASTDVCIPGGGAVEAYWKAAIATAPCHKEGDNTGPQIIESYEELIEKTVRKECKYTLALGATLLHAVVGKHCGRLVQTGEPFFEDAVSFVVPRGSNMLLELSNATLQLKAEGALPSFHEYLRRREQCTPRSSPTLTFQKLRIFFYVAYSVCFLIFLEMVVDPQTTLPKSAERNDDSSSEGKNSERQCDEESNVQESSENSEYSFQSLSEENA